MWLYAYNNVISLKIKAYISSYVSMLWFINVKNALIATYCLHSQTHHCKSFFGHSFIKQIIWFDTSRTKTTQKNMQGSII